jgi:hypothetical protein
MPYQENNAINKRVNDEAIACLVSPSHFSGE